MEVILLEKIENLGNLGEMVNVKPGFGRNFLIPNGKAKSATPENVAEFEAKRAQFETVAAEALTAAQARADKINGLAVSITCQAGDEGKLFGSVGTGDIAEAVTATGAELSKQEVRMPEGALRHVGEFEIGIHLHTDVDAIVKVTVVAET